MDPFQPSLLSDNLTEGPHGGSFWGFCEKICTLFCFPTAAFCKNCNSLVLKRANKSRVFLLVYTAFYLLNQFTTCGIWAGVLPLHSCKPIRGEIWMVHSTQVCSSSEISHFLSQDLLSAEFLGCWVSCF